jgi:hypothetical protein
MKKIIAITLLLSIEPAEAKCHHYSRWYYTTPQHCSDVAYVEPAKLTRSLVITKPEKIIFPLESIPTTWEKETWKWNVNREMTLELLRHQLKERGNER